MTIAACYVSPEGVVLGADSTSTYAGSSGQQHYYNFAQKLFELSNEPGHGTLGAVTWGLGGLQISSHRTLLAEFSDEIKNKPPKSVAEAADRWSTRFWTSYSDPSCPIAPQIAQCKVLEAKKAHDPNAPADPSMRTQAEEQQLANLQNTFTTGFCIGGYVPQDRKPAAFEIIFRPSLANRPTPNPISGVVGFWGAPNMIQRLIMGGDDALKDSIMKVAKMERHEGGT